MNEIEKPNLMERIVDLRKTAYVLYLVLNSREYWHKIVAKGKLYEPSVFRLVKAEGMFEKEMIPEEKVAGELAKGRSLRYVDKKCCYEARKHMAPEHIVTVMVATEALAREFEEKGLLNDKDVRDLRLAAAVHDVNKDIEFRVTRLTISDEKAGFGQAGYDLAGDVSEQKLRFAGVPERIIRIHMMVGHASCPETEEILKKEGITNEDLMILILHYVDDIVTSPNVIDPEITYDQEGKSLNALDRRCIQNEKNPTYINYNQAWVRDSRNKTGETAFAMQRRVGHLVEARLAKLLGVENPLRLPEFIYRQMQKNIHTYWEEKRLK